MPIASVMRISLNESMFELFLLRYAAIAIMVAILAISDG